MAQRARVASGDDLIARGLDALAAGAWETARDAFAEALAVGGSPEALDGLGRALWWLRRPADAVRFRQRAYRGFRRRGDDRRAFHTALWLAREHSEALGRPELGRGWLARAERLAGALGAPEQAWLALGRAEREPAADVAAAAAQRALDGARRCRDVDLETRALAALGLNRVRLGEVDAGMACLDEAMAAATGEALAQAETAADVCCRLVEACELIGDTRRMQHWGSAIEGFLGQGGPPPLLSFCGACCGEVLIASGNWGPAEEELTRSLDALRAAGETARCVHPAARLAGLRLLQGRLEDAAELLSGNDHLPESVRPLADLHLARGEPRAAARLLARRLRQVGDAPLLAAPLLVALVDAHLADGDRAAARLVAGRLTEAAARTGQPRLRADADLAAGRVAAATGDPRAAETLEAAVQAYGALSLPHHQARARLALARALAADEERTAAQEQARAALAVFERLGATRDADATAALLRGLGVRGGTGPKGFGTLTRRETDVLALLGRGLTNAEIAARLYISPKTAGNHVSSVLSKLGLRNRAEAAAFAQRAGGTAPRPVGS